MHVLIVQQLPIFYDQAWSQAFGYQILTGLSIQLIGVGFAGMCRRFIVYPERESHPLHRPYRSARRLS